MAEMSFSSAGLLALAAAVLAARDAALVPAEFVAPDPMAGARAPEGQKAGLLDHALAVGGPVPLLAVGQGLDRLRGAPTMEVLAKSESVAVLAEKWNRLARYHHARNRAEVSVRGQRAEVRRFATHGPPPRPAENVFIAGVLVGLVGLLPVTGVALEVGGWRGAPPDWPEGLPVGDCARFALTWEAEAEPRRPDATEAAAVAARLGHVLARDAGRGWRIGEAARALAMSQRSLQRRLSAEGTRFSAELRRVRVAEAGRMLAGSRAPLAEVGYCCGYADQAHFQREFLKVTNMTPGRFRQVAG
ncbi:helix-turn-helix transcriptional regulator [Tropicimonas marinistellae]|uniref:helix-turn-helix transcriptional regulator n=1 Tax=Tropicimonas marinistellae TaxID=1739787 RepID=UPI00082BA43A|nr:AraC family transcriptional regulator [Tropicimonas marinistellae]